MLIYMFFDYRILFLGIENFYFILEDDVRNYVVYYFFLFVLDGLFCFEWV